MKFTDFIDRPRVLAGRVELARARLEALRAGTKCASAVLTGLPKAKDHTS